MGAFAVKVEVGDPQGQRFEQDEALVDTGSTYSAFPADQLRRLGVTPLEQREFLLADGRHVKHDVGQTYMRIDGKAQITVVVFADEGTQPFIGAVTLEEFGLGIDPVEGTLHPVPGYRLGRRPIA